jgi:hypothetical protein
MRGERNIASVLLLRRKGGSASARFRRFVGDGNIRVYGRLENGRIGDRRRELGK